MVNASRSAGEGTEEMFSPSIWNGKVGTGVGYAEDGGVVIPSEADGFIVDLGAGSSVVVSSEDVKESKTVRVVTVVVAPAETGEVDEGKREFWEGVGVTAVPGSVKDVCVTVADIEVSGVEGIFEAVDWVG